MQDLNISRNDSDSSLPTLENNKKINDSKTRQQRLKQIDALYKSQMDKIYKQTSLSQSNLEISKQHFSKQKKIENFIINNFQDKKQKQAIVRKKNYVGQKFTYENQLNLKDFNILGSDKGQFCLSKQKKHQVLNQFDKNDKKSIREQVFNKVKLEVVGILDYLQVANEQLSEIKKMNDPSEVLGVVVRKVKQKLRQLRIRQENLQSQRGQMLSEKHEQRVHYLVETNQMLQLGQGKLKQKNQDLRGQLTIFLGRLQDREHQLEEKESQLFHARRQCEQLNSALQKGRSLQATLVSEHQSRERQSYKKHVDMKAQISTHLLTIKRIANLLQEKQTQVKELTIKLNFLQQETQRTSRQAIRWRQRFQWLQNQKQLCIDKSQSEKLKIIQKFEQFKQQNNAEIIANCRKELQDALRKTRQVQQSYRKIQMEVQKQKLNREEQQKKTAISISLVRQNWSRQVKEAQMRINQQRVEMQMDHNQQMKQLKEQQDRKHRILVDEMQSKMKTLLADHDKRMKQQMIELQRQNQQLRKQIESLNKVIQVKETLITLINNKRESVSNTKNISNTKNK